MEHEIQLAERTLKSYRANPKDKTLFQPGQEVSVMFNVDDVVIVRNDSERVSYNQLAET